MTRILRFWCVINKVLGTSSTTIFPKHQKIFRLHIYVLLLGQMVYIFVFISYFGFSDSWVLFRTELYMNWMRTMLMIRPVTILILVSKGNILILTGPSLKDWAEGSSLTSADLRNLKSASDTGFETAEPRRTHRSTCFLIFQCFSDHKWASIQRNYYWRASL